MARRGERVASIRRLEEEEERVARLERVAKGDRVTMTAMMAKAITLTMTMSRGIGCNRL
jgi:hypothetical protein